MRSWWWIKEKKKQMALMLIIVTTIHQFQMKGCAGCVESERMGLLQLKSYLNSLPTAQKGSILDSWRDDDPKSECCNWDRVKCSDAIGGHIVDLSLNYLLYSWKIDQTDQQRRLNISLLHSFPQLKTLDVSDNWFDHLFIDPIHVLKDMPKLQELDLSGNEFTDIDSLVAGLMFPSSLQVLNLRYNQLSRTHEGYSKLCGLRNLRKLDLSLNALTRMPNCLGNLSRLRTLELSNNQLNGNLSAFVSGLPPELEYLSLLENNFNGSSSSLLSVFSGTRSKEKSSIKLGV